MGIGRKQFNILSNLALAGMANDPLDAVVIHDNVYVNKKLGILFYKPKNWGFIAVKDFGKIKSEQVIGEGLEDSQEEIWAELGAPICIATKYYEDKPEYKGVFSPTITLNITPKDELEHLGHETFEELIGMSAFGTSNILKEFEVTKKYEPYFISNCKFYEYDAQYLFEHFELNEPLKVELKILKTEHDGFYYDFNCHQSKAQNQLAKIEFEEFKKSIKLM